MEKRNKPRAKRARTLDDVVSELGGVQVAILQLGDDVAVIRKLLERLMSRDGERVP